MVHVTGGFWSLLMWIVYTPLFFFRILNLKLIFQGEIFRNKQKSHLSFSEKETDSFRTIHRRNVNIGTRNADEKNTQHEFRPAACREFNTTFHSISNPLEGPWHTIHVYLQNIYSPDVDGKCR